MNHLDLWKHVQRLSVDEFMCLLFGLEPGTVIFDYGNPDDWPKGAVPVYRALTSDVRSNKLDVFFENDQDNPWNNDVAASHYFHTGEPWWRDGKLYRHQLVKWLAAKGIQSEFFSETQTVSVQVPAQPNGMKWKKVKPAPAVTEPPQPEITQEEAAQLAGVDTRTIRNWEKGEGTPPGFPGRQSRAVFMAFVEGRESNKRFKSAARAMNRAQSGGDMSEYGDSDYSEEEDN